MGGSLSHPLLQGDNSGGKLLRDKIEKIRRDPTQQQLYKMLRNYSPVADGNTENGQTKMTVNDVTASSDSPQTPTPRAERPSSATSDDTQRMKSMTPKEKFLKGYRDRSGSLTRLPSTTPHHEGMRERVKSDAMMYAPARSRGQRLVSVSDCIDNIINSQITRRGTADPLQMISAQVSSIAPNRESSHQQRQNIGNWATQVPAKFRAGAGRPSSVQNGRPVPAAVAKTHTEPAVSQLPVPRHYGPSFTTTGTPVYSASNICPQIGPARQSCPPRSLPPMALGSGSQQMPSIQSVEAGKQQAVCFPVRLPEGSMRWQTANSRSTPQSNMAEGPRVSPGIHVLQGVTPGGATTGGSMRMSPTSANTRLSPGGRNGIHMPFTAISPIKYDQPVRPYVDSPSAITKQFSDNDPYATRMPPPLIRITLAPPVIGSTTENRAVVAASSMETIPVMRRPYEKPLDLSSQLESFALTKPLYPNISMTSNDAPLDLSVRDRHMSKVGCASSRGSYNAPSVTKVETNVPLMNIDFATSMNGHNLPRVNGHIAGMESMKQSIEDIQRPATDPIPHRHQQPWLRADDILAHKTHEAKQTVTANLSPDDNLYITCNMCHVTYGSQHSIAGHFRKMHGREPEPHLISVQSFSEPRRDLSQGSNMSTAIAEVSNREVADIKTKLVDSDKKSVLECNQCGEEFPTRDWGVFRRHVRAHDVPADAAFKCTVCSAGFCNPDARRQHMTRAHNITSCLCRTCDIGFTHIGALSRHLRTAHHDSDSVDVEYRCLYCPKMFVQQQQLFDHTRRHESIDGDIGRADKAVSVRPTSTPPHQAPDTTYESKDVKDINTNDVFDRKVSDKKSYNPFPPKIHEPRFNMELFNRNMSNAKVCVPNAFGHKSSNKTTAEVKPHETKTSDAPVENSTKFEPIAAKTSNQKMEEVTKLTAGKNSPCIVNEESKKNEHDDMLVDRKRKIDTVGSLVMTEKRARPENVSHKLPATCTARSLIDDIVESAVSIFNRTHTPGDEKVPKESRDERVKTFMAEMLRSFPTLRTKPDNIRDIIESLVTAEIPNDKPSAAAAAAADVEKETRASPSAAAEVVMEKEKKKDEESSVKAHVEPSVTSVVKPAAEVTPVVKETPMLTDYEPQLSSTAAYKRTKRGYSEPMPAITKAKKYGSVRYPAMFADFHPMQCLASESDHDLKEVDQKKKKTPTIVHKLYPSASSIKPKASTSKASTSAKDSDGFSSLFAEFHPTLCSDHACDGEDGHDHHAHHSKSKDCHDHSPSHDHHHHHHDADVHDDEECVGGKQVSIGVSARRHHCAAASGSADKMASDASPCHHADAKHETCQEAAPSSPL